MSDRWNPCVPVSWGELLDKLTILEIKRERIAAARARANVVREHDLLRDLAEAAMREPGIAQLMDALRQVNVALWEIEDAIRAEESIGQFGARFVELARAVYRTNDERAAIKRRINLALASDLIEEKSYGASG